MRNHLLFKLAASVLVMGTLSLGVTAGGSIQAATITSIAPKTAKQAQRLADKARAALVKRDGIAAVVNAEQAVALSPRHGDYRALLGQSYMLAGRFIAAEASFQDAIALDPTQTRAGLSLALSQIALGKWESARAMLAGLEGRVTESDRGLALALAGDKDGAVTALETAARGERADAKTRQNLALAYALAGNWEKARATAAQDLAPRDVFLRMTEWAKFAQPKSAWDQIASLLGVIPVEDAGQPVALALAPVVAEEAVALADTPEPTVEPVMIETAAPEAATLVAPVVVALEAAPLPVSIAPVVVAAAPVQAPLPVYVAAPQPVAMPAPPALIAAPRASAKISLIAARKPAPPQPRQRPAGNFVVQLGAYSTAGRVLVAWDRAVGRHTRLASYSPSSARFVHAGATVHRLTLSGFATRAEAVSLCNGLKAQGRACFVRAAAGEQPVQWVKRKTGTQLAAR